MNIDNRLKRITDFIPSDSYILDVGCDHALLDIYLALNRKNVKLIASDINENPLKKAQENIRKYNLEDKITLVKADGISKINDEVDIVKLRTKEVKLAFFDSFSTPKATRFCSGLRTKVPFP